MTTAPLKEQPLEERVTRLERQMDHILHTSVPVKDWASTVGAWKDDAFSREADKLGQEWRESVKD